LAVLRGPAGAPLCRCYDAGPDSFPSLASGIRGATRRRTRARNLTELRGDCRRLHVRTRVCARMRCHVLRSVPSLVAPSVNLRRRARLEPRGAWRTAPCGRRGERQPAWGLSGSRPTRSRIASPGRPLRRAGQAGVPRPALEQRGVLRLRVRRLRALLPHRVPGGTTRRCAHTRAATEPRRCALLATRAS
jgi:hypothetical protein